MDGETEAHLERAIDEISEERDQLQAEIAELKAEVEQFQAIIDVLYNLTQHLALSPIYLKKIPLNCEAGVGPNYGECK